MSSKENFAFFSRRNEKKKISISELSPIDLFLFHDNKISEGSKKKRKGIREKTRSFGSDRMNSPRAEQAHLSELRAFWEKHPIASFGFIVLLIVIADIWSMFFVRIIDNVFPASRTTVWPWAFVALTFSVIWILLVRYAFSTPVSMF
jgi:hypothetical protein